MASSGTTIDTAVSDDGVEIQQRYTETEFDLPSVVFTLTSERPEPVQVRFEVPDIEARKVGFHPAFKSDGWTISEEQLVFEARVEPNRELTTLYAIDTDDRSVFERAMDSLRIEHVEPISTEGGSPRDQSSDERDGATDGGTADIEETQVDDDETDVTDAIDAVHAHIDKTEEDESELSSDDSGQSETGNEGTAAGGERAKSALAEQPTAELVEALCERIEDGDLAPDHRERLRAAGLAPHERAGADEARLANLQARVSDIEAFTAYIERFAERHGPPAAVFGELEERLAAVEGVEERVEEIDDRAEGVDERVEGVEERVDTLRDDLESAVEQLESDLAAVEAEVGTISETVSDVETQVTTAREDASGAEERASAVERELERTEDRLAELDNRLEGFAGDWETLEDDVTALREWRNNLASTFEAFEE